MNKARYKIFAEKLASNGLIDLSILPPCRSVVRFHLYRVCYITYYWKKACTSHLEYQPVCEFGWHADGTIQWFDVQFPEAVETILVDEECEKIIENEEYFIEDEHDSDTEDEEDC